MEKKDLGKLEQLDIKEAWTDETKEFTPWLAIDENIALLGDAIGMELEVQSQEQRVGLYRADIVCKDTITDEIVLIENQLEQTDHRHLGQILTYASGLEAMTIIWISKSFTDEHRATLDWLNEITKEKYNFFGIEVELWKIGDSKIAPKFNIVCMPSDWRKTAYLDEIALSEDKKMQLDFWNGFIVYLKTEKSTLKSGKTKAGAYLQINLGSSLAYLELCAGFYDFEMGSFSQNLLRVSLVLRSKGDPKHIFNILEKRKNEIQSKISEEVTWYNPEDKQTCRIYMKKNVDLYDLEKWQEYYKWLKEKSEKMYNVFSPIVKDIKDSDVQESTEEEPGP